MFISAEEHTIKFNTWKTERELAHALASCDAGSIVLGDDVEDAREFYSATAYLKWPKTNEGHFGVGICSESHGLMPHLLMRSNTNLLVFGLNSEAVGISLVERRQCFRMGLDALFHSFIQLKEQKLILVLHEIGVVAITEDGSELWRYSKDVIVDFTVEQSVISLNFMDSPPVSLELASGHVIGTSPRS